MSDTHENIEPPNAGALENAVDAEIIEAEIVETPNDKAADTSEKVNAPINTDAEVVDLSVQRLSAKGGAVGAVLLALLGLAGMAFSSYSFFNLILAALFSIWGLRSPLRKTALVGLMLSLVGLLVFVATSNP